MRCLRRQDVLMAGCSGQLGKLHAIPEKPEHHEQTGAWFIEGEKTFNGKKTPGAAL